MLVLAEYIWMDGADRRSSSSKRVWWLSIRGFLTASASSMELRWIVTYRTGWRLGAILERSRDADPSGGVETVSLCANDDAVRKAALVEPRADCGPRLDAGTDPDRGRVPGNPCRSRQACASDGGVARAW